MDNNSRMDRAKNYQRMEKNCDTKQQEQSITERKTDMGWRHHGSFAVKVGLGLPLEGWVEFDQTEKRQRKEQSSTWA